MSDLTWEKGGVARVLRIDANTIALESSIPSPPGSRISGALVSDPTATLRVKIHVSKKQEDGTFLLEGRPIDLTRELREKLMALAGKDPP
ncbi:MAG: hypothetical protein ABIP39_02515 [Polyangiaceae bacterium]